MAFVAASFAQDSSEIIGALASLAWPAVVGFSVYLFRREIAAMLRRLRRVKTGVGELELDQELDALQQQARKATETLPPEAPGEPAKDIKEDVGPRILDEAASSPKLALMDLSAETERRAREVLASSQEPSAWERRSLGQKLRRLELSPAARDAASNFQNVRNEIVHGHEVTEDEILRAIDLGLMVLDAIDRIPHELHYVLEPSVESFADESGNQPYRDFHGVLLESVSADGKRRTVHAFPTTRDHFKKGKPVSWEWNSARTFPEFWYRDPQTGELKYGQTAALEFVGRPLDEI